MDESTHLPKQTPNKQRRPRILRPTAIIILLLLGAGIFFAVSYFRSTDVINHLQQAAAKSPDSQVNELIRKIGSHIVLPDERPTIATVEDTKKLADQTFFKHARQGDKVLMYPKAKKAILYRPSDDKVIEVAYLNIQDKAQ